MFVRLLFWRNQAVASNRLPRGGGQFSLSQRERAGVRENLPAQLRGPVLFNFPKRAEVYSTGGIGAELAARVLSRPAHFSTRPCRGAVARTHRHSCVRRRTQSCADSNSPGRKYQPATSGWAVFSICDFCVHLRISVLKIVFHTTPASRPQIHPRRPASCPNCTSAAIRRR